MHTVNRQGHWGFCSLNGKGRPRSERRIPAARLRDGNSASDQTDHSGAPCALTDSASTVRRREGGPTRVRPSGSHSGFNRHHSSVMNWTLKGREEAKPLQERSPGKSPGTGGQQAETAEAGEDGFFVGGRGETAVRQGHFKMVAGSCSRPWRAAAAQSKEERATPAEQRRGLAELGAFWAEQRQRTLVHLGGNGKKSQEKRGAYEGGKRRNHGTPSFQTLGSAAKHEVQAGVEPDIHPAPARHSVRGKSPRKAQVREKRRARVLEPCQRSLWDEEREAIGKDIHRDAKKHTSAEAENQGHLIAMTPPQRGAPGPEHQLQGPVCGLSAGAASGFLLCPQVAHLGSDPPKPLPKGANHFLSPIPVPRAPLGSPH